MNYDYEMLTVFPGTLSEAELPDAVEKNKTVMAEQGAKNLMVSDLGKNRLAYPMKHIRYGYFWLMRFEAESDAIPQMEHKLRLQSGPLRQVIRKYNPAKAGETPKTQTTVNEIIRGVRGDRMKKDAPEGEKMREIPAEMKQVVEKGPEKETLVDSKKDKQVPLEAIGEQLDEILEKSLSNV